MLMFKRDCGPMAVCGGGGGLVLLLLERGADPNAQGGLGGNAL